MAGEYIQARQTNGVLVVTMDDPPTRNAIGIEMVAAIEVQLDLLESDPSLRALVLTGHDPSFCSGANVRKMHESNLARSAEQDQQGDLFQPWDDLDQAWADAPENSSEEMDAVRMLTVRLHKLQKPSIAAVNGHAIGLGMGIALACDIRIASERAQFSEAFIRNGLIPADGSTWFLPRLIGLGNTLLLQYTGDMIPADDAYRMGIVSQVVPHDDLMGTVMDLAQRLAQGPTYSIALIKKLVQQSLKVNFEESMKLAGPAQALARKTHDHREGVQAFLEKRRPHFKGR
ncbi:MAG: enoyl-CoA hydratase-related protein [Chloroflexi bacterium]|nr:enoyl-CoA hydratase-related protein [Chloroflexota bacterium]